MKMELPFPVPASPTWRVDWEALQIHPWVQSLQDCPQDPVHHAEGNVWIHTRMVLEALTSDGRFRDLPVKQQFVVFAAALLHDIAKPATTVVEPEGRVIAKGHSLRGSIMAREILWKLGVPFAWREQVCGLIRYHQAPFYLIDRPDAQRLAAAISFACSCSDLSILAEADLRGRICQDADPVLRNIELFREFCSEEGCLHQPRSFPSDHARVEYFRHENRAIGYQAYDDTIVEVIVMSGLPGAGKDAWIGENEPDLPTVSLDLLREELEIAPTDEQGTVVQAARERARRYLRNRQSFIWNATNVSRMMRSQVLRLLMDYHAKVRIVYIESSFGDLFAQNTSRSRIVPASVIHRLLDRWTVPDLTEAHQVEYVIHEN